MEKKQFLFLLYLCGIVPMIYSLSIHLFPQRRGFGFGILNMITLIIFTMIFNPSATLTTQKKKKNILLVIGGLLLLSVVAGSLMKFSNKASQRLYETAIAPSSHTDVVSGTLFSGNQLSGTILSGDKVESTGSVEIQLITGDVDINKLTTGNDTPSYTKPIGENGSSQDTFETKKEVAPLTTSSTPSISTTLSSKGNLNYAQVITYLVSHYGLKNISGKYPTFTYVAKTNTLYPTFAIAASKGMIGASTNPTNKVSCNTYLVLKGIAAGWKVDYKAGDPFSAYRTTATTKGAVNGCAAGAFVTKATL